MFRLGGCMCESYRGMPKLILLDALFIAIVWFMLWRSEKEAKFCVC